MMNEFQGQSRKFLLKLCGTLKSSRIIGTKRFCILLNCQSSPRKRLKLSYLSASGGCTVTLDPARISLGLCCRAGAFRLPRRICGVRRLSVIPHSGSSTWDLFPRWTGRQAAHEDTRFSPVSVAVNAGRGERTPDPTYPP